jgi:MFS family permease
LSHCHTSLHTVSQADIYAVSLHRNLRRVATNFAIIVTSRGHSSEFGFQILAILNAGSFFGRYFAGLVADMIGRVNTLILTLAMCVLSCFALWLPAGESTAMIVVFAVIFGFGSGSNLSLSPVW